MSQNKHFLPRNREEENLHYICICTCACMYMRIYVPVHSLVNIQESKEDIRSPHVSLTPIDAGSLSEPGSRLAASKLQKSPVCRDYRCVWTHRDFLIGFGDLNSVPHICTASSLTWWTISLDQLILLEAPFSSQIFNTCLGKLRCYLFQPSSICSPA